LRPGEKIRTEDAIAIWVEKISPLEKRKRGARRKLPYKKAGA